MAGSGQPEDGACEVEVDEEAGGVDDGGDGWAGDDGGVEPQGFGTHGEDGADEGGGGDLDEECEAYLVVSKDLGADSLLKWMQESFEQLASERIDTAKGFRIIRSARI